MNLYRSSLFAGIVLIAMVASIVAGCAYRAAVHPHLLAEYRGDGQISKIKNIFNPGVELVFEPFPLAHEFTAIYRIDGLPKRPAPYWVDLVVPEPGDQWKIRSGAPIRIGVPGTLKLSARRATGEVIFECEWSPEEEGWSMDVDGAAAGYLDHTHKRPRDNETDIWPEEFRGPGAGPSTLEVVWKPEPATPDKMAYVRMRSGGSM